MDVEEIIQKKPHLKDIINLYKKISEFNRKVSGLNKDLIHIGDVCYPPELIDPILEIFSSTLDVPLENLTPLKEALKFSQIDLTRLTMNEVPSFSLPYHEDELLMILFILSKPYFLDLRRLRNLDYTHWKEGRCPVCGARPSMSSIDEYGRKKLHCSFCETTGYHRRMECPLCQNFDTSRINIITFDGEEGLRVDACDECGSYVKTVTNNIFHFTTDLADLVSIPLDIIAQSKGYKRNSPNPIGMIKIG
jgi:FdhE protein